MTVSFREDLDRYLRRIRIGAEARQDESHGDSGKARAPFPGFPSSGRNAFEPLAHVPFEATL
jgi:hypothetical protein